MLRYDHTIDDVIVTLKRKGESDFEQVVGNLKKFDYKADVVAEYLRKMGVSCTWLQWAEKIK